MYKFITLKLVLRYYLYDICVNRPISVLQFANINHEHDNNQSVRPLFPFLKFGIVFLNYINLLVVIAGCHDWVFESKQDKAYFKSKV